MVKGLPAEWGVCFRTVLLDSPIYALSHHSNSAAVGSDSRDIMILDTITGSQAAIFYGHSKRVRCLTFSIDGTSLVSGSDDNTVKLWDVQTGGVVKTFSGHTQGVYSVSISADCTMIASGSSDSTVHLWDIQRGECQCVIRQENTVWHVSFSPIDPQYLISMCDDKLWQWNTSGHQIKPPFNGSCSAFSSDGTQLVSCNWGIVMIQNTDSGAIIAKFQMTNDMVGCCFSPDERFVAIAGSNTVYIWDITSPNPYIVKTFIGHTDDITSLAFSSPTTLISASWDRSIKFWQIGASSIDSVIVSPKPRPPTSAPIKSITLQTKDGITITSDLDGIVKTWDISTGLHRASFQTPAKDFDSGDVQLINGRLIFAWGVNQKIHIWGSEKEKHLEVDGHGDVEGLRVSGDGSRVFSLDF